MRLLILTPYPPLLGGVSVHARGLGQALAARGHDVWVVTPDERSDSRSSRVEPDGRVVVCRVGGFGFEPADYVGKYEQQNLRALEGVLLCAQRLTGSFDLLAVHGHFFAMAALSAIRAIGLPMVFHAHNMISATPGQRAEEHAFFAGVEGAVIREAAAVIAISDYIAELCLKLDAAPERLNVVPKGLHLEQYAGAWRPQDSDTLLFVGRLSPEKGLDTLLAALVVLRERGRRPRLLIVGSGEPGYVAEIRERIRSLELRRSVALLGPLAEEELPRLYRAATVTVVPSHMEALGRVALEAMAAGAPVVVSDVGGLGPLIQHGTTGWKVPPRDPVALATAIEEALDNPDRAAKVGEAARAVVAAGYSWERVLEATVAIYEGIVR